ncbi:hypothetical protein DAI22_08g037250 [Oryza sativa Japonica Group]|nr:hypothetical protein DAI22_08g037250 [Oryza sativa Japonica Group]
MEVVIRRITLGFIGSFLQALHVELSIDMELWNNVKCLGELLIPRCYRASNGIPTSITIITDLSVGGPRSSLQALHIELQLLSYNIVILRSYCEVFGGTLGANKHLQGINNDCGYNGHHMPRLMSLSVPSKHFTQSFYFSHID